MTDHQPHTDPPGGGEINRDAARSSSLELSEEALSALSRQATALVTDYFLRIDEYPVFPRATAESVRARLDTPLPVDGVPLEQLLDDCRAVISQSRHNGHPRFFGYVASPSTAVGAYADLIASALNANVTSWRSAPAATEIESIVIRWLGEMIGYAADARGLLTSGGSAANLTAILMAHRSKAGSEVGKVGLWQAGASPMTIYASDEVHFSVPKAADVIGLGRDQVRLVPVDGRFRLDLRALRERVESDRRNGLRPFCVVASAGTVNTGAVDPLREIGTFAREHDLWFHIDGAYGAPGALDPGKRPLFDGIELADTVSLDPHKWMYAPVDCGCLMYRPGTTAGLLNTGEEADYVRIHEQDLDESFAFWDHGIELSRRFRALKIWMMLRYYGLSRLSAAIAEDNALAQYLGDHITAASDFELLAPAVLSICCFRYLPANHRTSIESAVDAAERERIETEADRLNEKILKRVQRGGRAYLSNARVGGRYALRACIVNFRCTRADLDMTLDIIREAAMELENES